MWVNVACDKCVGGTGIKPNFITYCTEYQNRQKKSSQPRVTY